MPVSTQPTSLWRNRDYLLLWSGQTISNIGSGVSQIALPLLVLFITGSPAQAGFVSAVRSLTYIIFILPAGALLDRWDRKRVMIFCDMGRAISLGSIPVAFALGKLGMVQIYLVAFIEMALQVFFDIAELACLPQVVSKEQLPSAMGRVQATIGVTNLIGPSLGGALFTLRPAGDAACVGGRTGVINPGGDGEWRNSGSTPVGTGVVLFGERFPAPLSGRQRL